MATFVQGTGQIYNPSPSTPVPIHNVSGDNTIEICGKNLFDKNATLYTGYINPTGGINFSSNFSHTKYMPIKPNTLYTTSGMPNGSGSEVSRGYYDKQFNYISSFRHSSQTKLTDTSPSNAYYMIESVRVSDIDTVQIEEGNLITTYEAYTGNSQLISLGVENLFDKTDIETGKYYKTSVIDTSSNWAISQVKVQPNTNYYLSGNNYNNNTAKIVLLDSSKNILSSVGGYYETHLITTSSTTAYIGLSISLNADGNDLNTIQLEKGSKANSYSEYGKPYIELNKISTYQDYIYRQDNRWYLHKEIGKKVLNGSETGWNYNSNNQGFTLANTSPVFSLRKTSVYDGYCNYFSVNKNSTAWVNVNYCGWNAGNTFWLKDNGAIATSLANFKTWLSTHNTTIYYILATPTDTEITDTTLLEQLNRLMTLSLYKNMTHITLTPNDLQPTMKIEYYRDTSLNNTFVPKTEMNKYYTKTETIAQIQIGNSSIQQNVAEIQTTLDSNGETINTISNQVQTLQSSTSLQINAINSQLENGVEKLTNSLVKIDANGINTSKQGETFNTQITNKTFEVRDGNKELAFIGYNNEEKRTIARMDDLESKRAIIGVHRTEVITRQGRKRTAGFYVGGDN